ncbi:MAG: Dabb family protein [Turicibacter sp.]
MIKHVVMWKIKDTISQTRVESMIKIKDELENLNGKIDGLIHIEVGIDFLKSDNSYDVILVSEFTNKVALEQYQVHPLHVRVANEIVKPVSSSRVVVDYECK